MAGSTASSDLSRDARGDRHAPAAVPRRVERLAWLLDESIGVPGTRFRIGLDGLLGLVPGIGDGLGALLSSYIVAEAARAGASPAVLGRMAFHILLEAVVGVIPVLGDLFDFGFKANARNVRLLRQHLETPDRTRRSSRIVVALVLAAAIAALVGLAVLIFAVFRWAWSVLFG